MRLTTLQVSRAMLVLAVLAVSSSAVGAEPGAQETAWFINRMVQEDFRHDKLKYSVWWKEDRILIEVDDPDRNWGSQTSCTLPARGVKSIRTNDEKNYVYLSCEYPCAKYWRFTTGRKNENAKDEHEMRNYCAVRFRADAEAAERLRNALEHLVKVVAAVPSSARKPGDPF